MIIGNSKSIYLSDTYKTEGTGYTRLSYDVEGQGRGPLAESKIPSSKVGEIYNDLYPVKARIKDIERITKMLASKNGIRWEGHTAALQTLQNIATQKTAEKYGGSSDSLLKQLGNAIVSNVALTATTLGQVAVAGTGMRFTPFESRAYMSPLGNGEGKSYVPRLGKAGNLFIKADAASENKPLARPTNSSVEISDIHNLAPVSSSFRQRENSVEIEALETDLDNYKNGKFQAITGSLYGALESGSTVVQMHDKSGYREGGRAGTIRYSEDSSTYSPYDSSASYAYSEGIYNKDFKSSLSSSYSASGSSVASENVKLRTKKGYLKSDDTEVLSPSNEYSEDNSYKKGKYTSGAELVRNGKILYNATDYGKDMSNMTITKNSNSIVVNPTSEQLELSGLIPFYISSISPSKRVDCIFEANLDSYSDSYTGNWEDIQYVGRADKFYVYSGFDRKIAFTFKVAAKQQSNLIPLYNNLNYLAGTTAPTYDEAGVFMRGTLTCVRIGDILNNQTGIFTQVNFKWDINVPWELSNGNGKMVVPHVLTVDVSFTPIHSFVPTADSIFFGDANQLSR